MQQTHGIPPAGAPRVRSAAGVRFQQHRAAHECRGEAAREAPHGTLLQRGPGGHCQTLRP